MTDIRSRQYRFGTAVHAGGTNQKSLRHWQERVLIDLTAPVDKKGAWQDFSLVDIFCIALVRRLVDHGVPVKEANKVAQDVIGVRVSNGPWDMSAEDFLAGVGSTWLIVRHIRPSEGEEGGWRAVEHAEGAILHLYGDDAFTAIDLATLLRGAFERAVHGYDMPADMYLKSRRVVLTALDEAGALKPEVPAA